MGYPIFYNAGKIAGRVDWANDVLKLAVVADTYVPNATHNRYSCIANYVLGTPQILQNQTYLNNTLNADDITFANITGSTRYRVLYKENGVLICYWDMGLNVLAGEVINEHFGSIGIVSKGQSGDYWFIDRHNTSHNKSAAAAIDMTVRRTFLGEQTVRLTITGGKSDLEDYGLGKNYTKDSNYTWHRTVDESGKEVYESSYTDITFAAGEQNKAVSIALFNNSQSLEKDRIIHLALTAVTGSVIGGDPTVTIVDDHRDHYVDLTNQAALTAIAATGTGTMTALNAGSSDNSAALQSIYDWFAANNKTVVGYLPDGTYRIKDVYAQLGVVLWGESKAGTVLKRVAGIAGRMFRSESLIWSLRSNETVGSTKPMGFVNLTVDGDNAPYRMLISVVNSAGVVAGDKLTVKYYVGGTPTTYDFTFVNSGTPADYQIQFNDAPSNTVLATRIYNALQILGAGYTITQVSSTEITIVKGDGTGYVYYGSTGLSSTDVYCTTSEQSCCLYLLGRTGTQRMQMKLEQILFKDNPAGQGSQLNGGGSGVDYSGYYLSTSGTFARGGLVMGIDDAVWNLNHVDMTGDFFHMEVDPGNTGVNHAVISNLTCNRLDASVGANASSTFLGKNIVVSDTWMVGANSVTTKDTYKFEGCSLTTRTWRDGWTSTTNVPYFTGIGRLDFYDCDFYADDTGIGASGHRACIPKINVAWGGTNGGMFFDSQCTFTGVRTAGSGALYAVLCQDYGVTNGNPSNNPYDFTACHFTNLDYLVASKQPPSGNGKGGVFRFHGACIFNSITNMFYLQGLATNNVWFELMVDNVGNLNGIGSLGYIYGGTMTGNKMIWEGTSLTLAQNTVANNGLLESYFTSSRVNGAGVMRTIINTGADVTAGFGMYNVTGPCYDVIDQATDKKCTKQGRTAEATWANLV